MPKINRNFKRCLITGITGAGGSYLAEYLLQKKAVPKLFGFYRSLGNKKNLETKHNNKIKFFKVDLNNFKSTKKALNKIKPDLIFNLASNPDVRYSFDFPKEVITNNSTSTLNILEAVRVLKLKSLIIHCSTSEVYGEVNANEVPIKEDTKLRPVSPYAISKTFQDYSAQMYNNIYNLNIIITRMFTYVNPRRNNLFQSAFAKQIIEIKKKKKKFLTHGNLESIRSFLSLNDCMKAYWLAAKKGKVGEIYNIGGTKSFKVRDVLKKLIKISKIKVRTKVDSNLIRIKDVTLQIPNTNKFYEHTGWRPSESLEFSLKFLFKELSI